MDVLRMIEIANANSNVAEVQIRIDSRHQYNDEIVIAIMNRYSSVYKIRIVDWNNLVNRKIHDWIKRYVQQQPIIRFGLFFQYGSLGSNDDGYELMKQYNQLTKQKQCLELLGYEHSRIGGDKWAKSKQEIQQLIDTVDQPLFLYLLLILYIIICCFYHILK